MQVRITNTFINSSITVTLSSSASPSSSQDINNGDSGTFTGIYDPSGQLSITVVVNSNTPLRTTNNNSCITFYDGSSRALQEGISESINDTQIVYSNIPCPTSITDTGSYNDADIIVQDRKAPPL